MNTDLGGVRAAYRQVRWRHAQYRPIFIAGAMGSGTSLLALSLGSRFDVAGVAYESALEVSTRSFLHMARVDSHRSVADYETAIQPDPSWSVEEARTWLRRLYRANTVRSSPQVVDKGPNVHLVRAGFLAKCFPDARFVLVVRDPVANIEGFRRKWPLFSRATVSENIGFYQRCHERFLELADSSELDATVVAYEDLVGDYEVVLGAIGEHLSLPRRAVVASVDPRTDSGGKGIRNVVDGRISVLPGTNKTSYERLSDNEISLIRADLADLHQRLLSRRLTRGKGKRQ